MRQVWAGRLRTTPRTLETAGPVFIERPDLTAAVVVRLRGTIAVAAPEGALSLLRHLESPQLLDVAALLGALEPARPSLLGAASLSFADRGTVSRGGEGTARAATGAEIAAVLCRCSAAEVEESGLARMSTRCVVHADTGAPAAAAGYETWGSALAHLGVAVADGSRGRGLGAQAAAAATLHALGAGLVPQWRCRVDNVASARVAESVGFVRLGDQVAIDLAPSP